MGLLWKGPSPHDAHLQDRFGGGLWDLCVFTGNTYDSLLIQNQADWGCIEGGMKIVMRNFGFEALGGGVHCPGCMNKLGADFVTYEWSVLIYFISLQTS